MHPNIEYFIVSPFWVETQKLKKIAINTFYFFMKSGEIKSRSPFSTESVILYCRGLPGASRQ